MIESYNSHGKLLITGEYLVIMGARALALPLNVGQSMEIGNTSTGLLNWVTLEKGNCIFNATLKLNDFEIQSSSNSDKAEYISNLLKAVKKLDSSFLADSKGCFVNTHIYFDMQWGLGTSSTLINNLAQWAKVDPFKLNGLVSRGSGYDIACAFTNSPLTYQLINSKQVINRVEFNPPFFENLSLVYLNKKMATENNISSFLQTSQIDYAKIEEINALTQKFISCESLVEFIELIYEHENIIASLLNQNPVKKTLFSDFEGAIKSLGAWGGDFILAASQKNYEKQRKYFNNKGYTTVIPLKDLMI